MIDIGVINDHEYTTTVAVYIYTSFIMQKDIHATVLDIIPLTKDSAEIVFTPTSPIDFLPGQFLMVEVTNPREDGTWQIMSPEKVFHLALSSGCTSIADIAILCPYLELDTIHKYINILLKKEYISITEDNIITFLVRDVTPRALPLKRAYSIGSYPGQETITTIVKETPNGFMSHYLLHRIQKGDEVLLTGPAGKFYLETTNKKDLLLIGAGSGITPLLSMLRNIKATKSTTPATFIYSNKTPEDIIAKDELDILDQEDHINIIHTITRPRESSVAWSGHIGRIDNTLIAQIKEYEKKHVFICGPLSFSKSMKEVLIASGVEESNISLEAYG